MSTLRTPVGPQPPSVYWRRRLLALLAVVAVIVVIVLIVSAIANRATSRTRSRRHPAQADRHPRSGSVGHRPSRRPPAERRATPRRSRSTAVTDSNSYDAGVNPQMSMTITNAGIGAVHVRRRHRVAGVHHHQRHRPHLELEGLPDQPGQHAAGAAARRRAVDDAVRVGPHPFVDRHVRQRRVPPRCPDRTARPTGCR